MAQYQKHYEQDLTQDIKIRREGTLVFNEDADSVVITVDVKNNGAAATLTGTASGSVIRSNGTTVPVAATISGSSVTMTLSGACCTIPGDIGVGIRITSGNIKTTILKAIYNVELYATPNVVDPTGEITIDVNYLVNRIETAVDSIPPEYSDLMASLAPAFSTATAYTTGQYVWYNGYLYKFTNDHSAGAWNIAHVDQAVLADDVAELYGMFSGDIADAVDDWLNAHPEATTTVQDGAITYTKLNPSLQNAIDDIGVIDDGSIAYSKLDASLQTAIDNAETVPTLNAARVNILSTRWHVDCVNGNDNDTGESGHAWKTLDKFFSMANALNGGRADIRCYLDTAGTYDVGTASDQITSFTGIAIHITGGTASDPEYDGNYIVRFLCTDPPKFYGCHINFKNLKIQCPNTTDFALDGGNASLTNCYIDTQLSIYTTPAHINGGTVRNVLISGSSVNATNVVTTLTTGNQWTLIKNASLLYGGSIGNNNLIASSTYPAFNVSASTLMPLQVYPTTLGPSITANNSFIMGTNARLTTWQAMADSLTNTIILTGSA